MKMAARFHDFVGDRSGAIAVMFALAFPILIGAAALATDVGAVYLQQRSLQTASDAAALAAMSRPASAAAVVQQMLAANGQPRAVPKIIWGNYSATASIDRDNRFVPLNPQPTTGAAGNAVRVELSGSADSFFAKIFNVQAFGIAARSDATAIASADPIVSLSAGSRLASIDPPLLNDVLGGLLGVNLKLNVADYNGLVTSKIKLAGLLKAILVDGLGKSLTDKVANDVLTTPIKLSVLVKSMAAELGRTGDTPGKISLDKAAVEIAKADVTVKLSEILRLDQGVEKLSVQYPAGALNANLGVLDVLNAAIRQEDIGTRLAATVGIPGVLTSSVEMTMGEALKTTRSVAIGQKMPFIETDQVRLRTVVRALGALELIAAVKVPIEVVIAGGTAKVVGVTCNASPSQREVRVEVNPGLVRASLGKYVKPLKDSHLDDVLDFEELVRVVGAAIDGKVNIPVKQVSPTYITFKGAAIGNGSVQTVKTRSIATSLVQSLLGETELKPRSLPLLGGLLAPVLSTLLPPVRAVLSGLVAPVDQLLAGVLAIAGVGLGEMDVRVDDLVCDTARVPPRLVG